MLPPRLCFAVARSRGAQRGADAAGRVPVHLLPCIHAKVKYIYTNPHTGGWEELKFSTRRDAKRSHLGTRVGERGNPFGPYSRNARLGIPRQGFPHRKPSRALGPNPSYPLRSLEPSWARSSSPGTEGLGRGRLREGSKKGLDFKLKPPVGGTCRPQRPPLPTAARKDDQVSPGVRE